MDVLSNGVGAWLGALLHTRVSRRLASGTSLVGRFFLDLPLVGLLYLLVPLLWLNALAVGPDPARLLLTLLLGGFGGSVLAGLQRFRLGPDARGSARKIALVGALGYLIGMVPLLPLRPALVMLLAGVVTVRIWLAADRRDRRDAKERRFELRVLRSAAPAFALYLLGLALAPLAAGGGTWSATAGFPPASGVRTYLLARLLESVAAFTVLGYLVAETGGRRERRYPDDLRRVLAFTALAAVLVEAGKGWAVGDAASGAQLLVLLGAGAYGGWLYHLQREQIVRLVGGGVTRHFSPPSPAAAPPSGAPAWPP